MFWKSEVIPYSLSWINILLLKHFQDDQNIGILKEAKEWAGELLSGQTKVRGGEARERR